MTGWLGGDRLSALLHAGGILDDALMLNQTAAHVRKVYAPKAYGAMNLAKVRRLSEGISAAKSVQSVLMVCIFTLFRHLKTFSVSTHTYLSCIRAYILYTNTVLTLKKLRSPPSIQAYSRCLPMDVMLCAEWM